MVGCQSLHLYQCRTPGNKARPWRITEEKEPQRLAVVGWLISRDVAQDSWRNLCGEESSYAIAKVSVKRKSGQK